MDDVTKWPERDHGKLFGYILQVKAVGTEYIGVYKDQKAYCYWMSSFAGPVWYSVCPSDKNIVFLKSEVSPSQRIHHDTHKVWVCFKREKKNFLSVHHGALVSLDLGKLAIMLLQFYIKLRRLVLYFWRACNSTQHKEIWWKNALEANSQMMSGLHKDVGV